MLPRSTNRLISKIVCAGLLLGTLPMSLPLRGQAQNAQELRRLKVEVKRNIDTIKTTNFLLKIAKALSSVKVATVIPPVAGLIITLALALAVEFIPPDLRALNIAVTISSIFPLFIGIILGIGAGIASANVLKFLKLENPVQKALARAKRIEELKRKHPFLLTPRQEHVLTKFNNLQKEGVTQAIIANQKTKKALLELADKAMEQNPLIVQVVGKEKARKTLANYIKLKWEKITFKKALKVVDKATKFYGTTERTNAIARFIINLKLKWAARKIKKLETRYPLLKKSLKDEVQRYDVRVKAILQEAHKKR